jgi:hypothetical protein
METHSEKEENEKKILTPPPRPPNLKEKKSRQIC